MPENKISSFESLLGSEVNVNVDVMPIVDVSAGTTGTKKIIVKELLANTSSFLQSGTNAFSRSNQEKLRELAVSITDFKNDDGTQVLGDGIRDNRTGIQRALDTVSSAGGGIVFIPRGIYLLNSFSSSFYTVRAKTGVSVYGEGPMSVLKVGNNLRSATQGITVLYENTLPLADITYRDFMVDWNGANNLQPSPETADSLVNRIGGAAGNKNVHFNRVYFKNSAGHHHITLQVASSGNPNGNCSVVDCDFNNAGLAIAGNVITDHSSIYLECPNSVISGNRFFMDNLNDTVCTAIDCINSPGSTLVGNSVYGYTNGFNVSAINSDASGITVSGNLARSVLTGLQLFSSGAFELSNVDINGNVFSCREIVGRSSFGILGSTGTLGSSVNAKRISISGNQFILESQGIIAAASEAITLTRCDDVVISDNQFHNWTGEAIIVASGSSRPISGYSVTGNAFRGCAVTSSASNKRVIVFNSVGAGIGSEIDFVDISDNQIICTAPAGTVANYGIQLNDGRLPHVKITNNTIEGAALSPITKGAVYSTDSLIIHGKGAYDPYGLIHAGLGSTWIDTGSANAPKRTYIARLVSADGNNTVWQAEYADNAAPASGTWRVGDHTQQTVPVVGSPKGWYCTVGGSPGTHVSEGNL